MYSHGRPRMGRDSILLRLMSRKANTLSALNNAPGIFLTLKTIEVLLAPGRERRDLRIRKNRVKLRLSSSIPAPRILPWYTYAAWPAEIPAEYRISFWMTCFTLPAVS